MSRAQADFEILAIMKAHRPHQIPLNSVQQIVWEGIRSLLRPHKLHASLQRISSGAPDLRRSHQICQSPLPSCSDRERLGWCNLVEHLQSMYRRVVSGSTVSGQTAAGTMRCSMIQDHTQPADPARSVGARARSYLFKERQV